MLYLVRLSIKTESFGDDLANQTEERERMKTAKFCKPNSYHVSNSENRKRPTLKEENDFYEFYGSTDICEFYRVICGLSRFVEWVATRVGPLRSYRIRKLACLKLEKTKEKATKRSLYK
ncbi:hypothetical protein GCM10007932_33860 [Vibrio penaeicida]|uniref:Uncharacterized protein n=2 Tax=Vibrio penaeicida TaxID=104609 RepID=A0AAV5NVM9_9VIBR|nr:hypothetical protein GCM10007932_33860 [Vibrio penaeicida]